MKSVAIVTIVDDYNFGNRLQNYALQYKIQELGFNCTTLKNHQILNCSDKFFLRIIKFYICQIKSYFHKNKKRLYAFKRFNLNINFSDKYITAKNLHKTKYDYYIVGSDQVWNPNFGGLKEVDLLKNIDNIKRISYAASFGVDEVTDETKNRCREELKKFKFISVREVKGKEIVEKITDRNDVEVMIDPTMMLSPQQWEKLIKKPLKLKTDKYILTYFLGHLSEKRKNEIKRLAKQNNCEIIDVLDKKSIFYNCGPSEFLYLEKNAFVICTDSFHSSVFAFLFDKPFVIFEREGSKTKMNSRLETFVNKFELKDRCYNNKMITLENLNHDYSNAYDILEEERTKSELFLKKALNCEDSD